MTYRLSSLQASSARLRAAAPLALLCSLALAGCSLYVGDDEPDPLEPEPTEPEPTEPEPSVPPTLPERLPSDPGVGVSFWLPEAVKSRPGVYVHLVWSFDGRAPRKQVFVLPEGADALSINDSDATMLVVTLFDEHGIIDTTTVTEGCPQRTWIAATKQIHEVPDDFATIQAAIDAAQPGDIVYVHSGVYREHLRMRTGVRLVGRSAESTHLVAPSGGNLIDFTEARDVVVRGFTLSGVTQATDNCDPYADAVNCGPSHFSGAIFGDGHDLDTQLASCEASAVVMHNIFSDNEGGVVLYYHAVAAFMNNLLFDATNGVIVNSHHVPTLMANNTFVDMFRGLSISRSETEVVDNIFVGMEFGFETEGVQLSDLDAMWFQCNAVDGVASPNLELGERDNDAVEVGFRDALSNDYRLDPDSQVASTYCTPDFAEYEHDRTPGAYGGPLGNWYQRPNELEHLRELLGVY
ncbi:NosD domain-containing protein [Haliangium ochraceum]|uniref:Periplasmic copper-binding protein NosD beta helix domain-containing protein n=1 Tax=Haliangium ochraceum (strain DSM 14365 / JCM 11303 / SMP-2) TaxID=502025 RepID=D0LKQ1_HALO1|nr:NosD domain-containing protein [Haliangium ochraceum]ACY15099.1 hypothetical protein Hoch_2565 [Haliangium ochraceum DSM 14365]